MRLIVIQDGYTDVYTHVLSGVLSTKYVNKGKQRSIKQSGQPKKGATCITYMKPKLRYRIATQVTHAAEPTAERESDI